MIYYGLPYKGSKNSIVPYLIERLPSSDTYYDLFCGGGAMLHGAILSGKYSHFVINDIKSITAKALQLAIEGVFGNETRWVSREEFQVKKNNDPYVAYMFNFGSDNRTYFCGKYIEPYYEALFNAYVNNDYSFFENELKIKIHDSFSLTSQLTKQNEKIKASYIEWFFKGKADLKELEQKRLNNELRYTDENEYNYMFLCKKIDWDKCEPLARFERAKNFSRLVSKYKDRITLYNTSYDNIEIKPNSTIYCDPPYFDTSAYDGKKKSQKVFDFENFYSWCERKENIFISEYYMPADRFEKIYSIEKRVLMGNCKGDYLSLIHI